MTTETRVRKCQGCGRTKPISAFRPHNRGEQEHHCLRCSEALPPGVPGLCPDCGADVLLWADTSGESMRRRITVLDMDRVIAWVEDIAIGPVLRAVHPIHACEKNAALTPWQRETIDIVWLAGEAGMRRRHIMDMRNGRIGMPWLKMRAEIDALIPGWFETWTDELGGVMVRYVGPQSMREEAAA